MDKPRHNDQLAVKKKIKKTPLHLPSLANNGCTSKNRLRRSIVPLLTPPPMPHDVPPPPPPPAMAQPTLNTAESPVSVSLQSSSGDSGPSARFSGGGGGILPTPVSLCNHYPQGSSGDSVGPNRNQMKPSHDYQQQQPPRFYGSSASTVPILPSPRFDGPGILPTPPPLQYPSPLQPRSFTSSSMAQGGILGPGKFPPRP